MIAWHAALAVLKFGAFICHFLGIGATFLAAVGIFIGGIVAHKMHLNLHQIALFIVLTNLVLVIALAAGTGVTCTSQEPKGWVDLLSLFHFLSFNAFRLEP